MADANPAKRLVSQFVSTETFVEALSDNLQGIDNVRVVFVPKIRLSEFFDSYYKTDHHWNGYGAMEAWNAVGEQEPLLEQPEDAANGIFENAVFNGTLSRRGLQCLNTPISEPLLDFGNVGITGNMALPLVFSPQEFPSRKEELRSRYDFYSLWYGDASGITTVNQAHSNERTAMVIGDSYAQSFRWFVAQSYSEMVYSHTLARSYSFEGLSDAIEASGADDIYLVGWACNFADLASLAVA